MKTTNQLVLLSLLAFAAAPLACSSDSTSSTTTPEAGTETGGSSSSGGATGSTGGKGAGGAATGGKGGGGTSTGGKGAGGASAGGSSGAAAGGADGGPPPPPPPPAIGATQIDRMGRPGVNTALTDPFDIEEPKTPDQIKDLYNAASSPAAWAGAFTPYIETNLAILDSLDRTCGNQFAAGAPSDGGPTNRYSALAGVLVDDELYVNTAAATCTTYLAVEANATTIIPNADCGGRTPGYDVIDVTYSALAIGKLSGVTDGVSSDTTGTQTATFPFLAPPQ